MDSDTFGYFIAQLWNFTALKGHTALIIEFSNVLSLVHN